MNKSSENIIKIFEDENLGKDFLNSSQAKFWESRQAPFRIITKEECEKEIPQLGNKD